MLKNVLITGASGFLGSVVLDSLMKLNFQIKTLGKRKSDDFYLDLAEKNLSFKFTEAFDTIIHLAGKAHLVPQTEAQKLEFVNVNLNGTRTLLRAFENPFIPKAFILISTVAVYGVGNGTLIKENTPLLAKDPYGLSKIQAEKEVQKWCLENNVTCAILRLPLVAGTNPPGNLGSMIAGIKRGYYLNIAGGKAKKSMVLAEDVAKIIPIVANIGGIYNLTDGYHPSFSELSELIAKQLNKKKPANIPIWLVKLIAKAGDFLGSKALINSDKLKKITSDLTFDDLKARELLGWNPNSVLKGFKIA